jgi:hypothetical protein
MKSVHWVVLLCSAAGLVFVATLAANFIGGRGGKRPPAATTVSQTKLTFADAVTDFPAAPPPADLEIGMLHAHDFWFKNDNPQALPLGMFSKSCQCTNVLVGIAPADWKDVPKEDERAKAAKDLEAAAPLTDLLEKDATATVPAGAVGLVRLTWNGKQLGGKELNAVLWMGEKGPGPTQAFNVRVNFIGPIRAFPEMAVGDDITPERLPLTVRIPCWSSTRTRFSLEAHVLPGRLKDKSNPFVVGEPVPMTEDDLAGLRAEDERNKLWNEKHPDERRPLHGAVLAGYWAPVTLNKLSADGTTAFDFGPFRNRVELTAESGDKLQVVVQGAIQGDLAPVNAGDVPVRFGPFDRTKEERRLIVLESDTDVSGLELDRTRTAEFLDVEFPKKPDTAGGRKTWNLEIKWVPDSKAAGIFPRGDEAMYRDSAVYVRPIGAKPNGTHGSYLRIPVMGTADSPP